MIYLLALFGLAYAQQKKQCLANVLAGVPGKVFTACDDISKVNALEADIRACKVQLGNCDGGGEQGQQHGISGSAQAVVLSYGDLNVPFSFTSNTPMGAAWDSLHEFALEQLAMDDDHDLTFDYKLDGDAKVTGKVHDDQTLEEAVNLAAAVNQPLVLTAHKTTIAPTKEPTKPWGTLRFVKQVVGNVGTDMNGGVNDANGALIEIQGKPDTRRSLQFNKSEKDNNMRLHYEDNLRTRNHGQNCYWELYVKQPGDAGLGKRCPKGYIRGAMHSHGNANYNNDHQTSTIMGLCEGLGAGQMTMNVVLYGSGNRDCYTGWDPESKGMFMMEAMEVRNGKFGYTGYSNRGLPRGEDNVLPIHQRLFTFTKVEINTTIRLVYADNFRVYNGGHCRWYLRVDDKICQGNKWIAQSVHSYRGDNDHLNQAFTGYCNGLAKGNHVVKAGVVGGSDCYTGWEGSFHMEAQEVVVSTKDVNVGRYMFMRFGNNIDGRDNGYVNWRVLAFNKEEDSSIIRVTYSDNLRVHGHEKWCKWEIRMDTKPCKNNLSGTRHVSGNQNDHVPGQIVGYCQGLNKGAHEMKIHVRGNSADCYTGWDRQQQNHFLLETVELDPGSVVGVSNEL